MPQTPDSLILPPGARPEKAIPKCPGCQQEFEPGQLIVHFIGATAPGALKTAPIHFGCALATAQAAAQQAEELSAEDEAELADVAADKEY